MNTLKKTVSSAVVSQVINYLEKNPEDHIGKIYESIKKLDQSNYYQKIWDGMDKIIENPDSIWNDYIINIIKDTDKEIVKRVTINFIINAMIARSKIKPEMEKKHDCRIPWAMLIDPTAACNLKCIGCWAAEYAHTANLSYEVLDRIISEGKELGIYMYLYSGGEPLVRKDDLIKLAMKHQDCIFLAFTNATLIDEAFAKDVKKAGNMTFAISVEGFEKETDLRRGAGTYKKIMKAMDILKKEGILFGFSTCYHSKNTDVVGSDQYVDYMIQKGCKYGWYFTYIPIGTHASMELLATAEQREYMYHRVRELRSSKPCFVLDFWNDGEYLDGCVAGGRNYLHINANGDIEPCAFIHYSNINIKECSIIEGLKQPLFREYEKNQPFNANHLRPCPLLDNPAFLRKMVQNANAQSTQILDSESVEDLTAKCEEISKKWAPIADKLNSTK